MPDVIQKLTEAFLKFPGIGPKQARRFVYYLLAEEPAKIDWLANQIKILKSAARHCRDCGHFFVSERQLTPDRCFVCLDQTRDQKTLMVVEKDVDLENLERSGVYRGRYFVLGGLIPLLGTRNSSLPRRLKSLSALVATMAGAGLKEIIIALAVHPEADFTAETIRQELAPQISKFGLRFSLLGRGLSTGSELEYSDPETLKNALKNRG